MNSHYCTDSYLSVKNIYLILILSFVSFLKCFPINLSLTRTSSFKSNLNMLFLDLAKPIVIQNVLSLTQKCMQCKLWGSEYVRVVSVFKWTPPQPCPSLESIQQSQLAMLWFHGYILSVIHLSANEPQKQFPPLQVDKPVNVCVSGWESVYNDTI